MPKRHLIERSLLELGYFLDTFRKDEPKILRIDLSLNNDGTDSIPIVNSVV